MAAGRTRSAMLHPQGSAQPGTMRLRKRTASGAAARRLSPSSGAQDAPLAATVEEEDEEGAVDFSGKDDAETVRGAKMKSETKKRGREGKREQVVKYIAKLGARIKCLLGREDASANGIVKLS